MAKQERAVRTRRAILIAAAAVFDEVGYEAATIADVLKRANVTKGALYFHFVSKEELAQAVLSHQVEAIPAVPERDLFLQQGMDEAFLMAYLLSQQDPLVRGSVRLTVEEGSPKDGLDRRAPIQAWLDHNSMVLARAKEAGEFLPHVDVATASFLFTSCFTGVQVLSKIRTGHADLPERVAELERSLMASVALPSVIMRLDFRPERGEEVYQEVMQLRQSKSEAG